LAKVNYRQQKLQREQKRKLRQNQKLERRAPKPDVVDAVTGEQAKIPDAVAPKER
jgi:hypothetical protein